MEAGGGHSLSARNLDEVFLVAIHYTQSAKRRLAERFAILLVTALVINVPAWFLTFHVMFRYEEAWDLHRALALLCFIFLGLIGLEPLQETYRAYRKLMAALRDGS